MFEPSFSFTRKTMKGYSYLYIQRAIYKRKKRVVESFSIGKLENIDQIFTGIMTSGESFFLGEILLYAFTKELKLDKKLEKIIEKNRLSLKQKYLLHWLMNSRVIRPFSKLKLSRYFNHSSFKLLTTQPTANEIYQLMDSIHTDVELFEQYVRQVFAKIGYTHHWTYYDTTTVYFYSDYDDLRRKAYAKDGKKGLPNIKFSLSCTEDYLPLTYKIFPGNYSDIACFKDFLNRISSLPYYKNKILSFDSGCYSLEIVQNLENEGYKYVCNADISKYSLDGNSQAILIDKKSWVIQIGIYKDRRIVEAFNEENYQKALDKLQRKIARVYAFCQDVTGRNLESKQKKIQSLINGLGLKPILSVDIQDNELVIKTDEKKLEKQKKKLRKLVIMSNLDSSIPPQELLVQYLGRNDVERVYRYLKTPLEVRPVYHWKHPRIYAHFFIVMLGYLHLTALRYYLNQSYGIALTLEQLLEDLSFSTIISIEPKKSRRMNYLGKQLPWIRQLSIDWNLNLKQEESPSITGHLNMS